MKRTFLVGAVALSALVIAGVSLGVLFGMRNRGAGRKNEKVCKNSMEPAFLSSAECKWNLVLTLTESTNLVDLALSDDAEDLVVVKDDVQGLVALDFHGMCFANSSRSQLVPNQMSDITTNSIAISGSGKRLAISATLDISERELHLFDKDESTGKWVPMPGSPFLKFTDRWDSGFFRLTPIGLSVALNLDGDTIVVGNSGTTQRGTNTGTTTAHRWSGADWVQLGQEIISDFGDSYGGYAVDVSADGNRLVFLTVSLRSYQLSYIPWHDRVKVYELDNTRTLWKQLGRTILARDLDKGQITKANGASIGMDASGTRIAVSYYADWREMRNATEVYVLDLFSGDKGALHWGVSGIVTTSKNIEQMVLSKTGTRISVLSRDSNDRVIIFEDPGHPGHWQRVGEIPLVNRNNVGIAMDHTGERLVVSGTQENSQNDHVLFLETSCKPIKIKSNWIARGPFPEECSLGWVYSSEPIQVNCDSPCDFHVGKNSVDISSDGGVVATFFDKLYQNRSVLVDRNHSKSFFGVGYSVKDFGLSSDGKRLVFVTSGFSSQRPSDKEKVFVVDLIGGGKAKRFNHTLAGFQRGVKHVAISGNGLVALVVSTFRNTATAAAINLTSGAQIGEQLSFSGSFALAGLGGNNPIDISFDGLHVVFAVNRINLFPNGTTYTSGPSIFRFVDGGWLMWDYDLGYNFREAILGISAITLSADGKRVAFGPVHWRDNMVALAELEDGRWREIFTTDEVGAKFDCVDDITLSHDGTVLAVGDSCSRLGAPRSSGRVTVFRQTAAGWQSDDIIHDLSFSFFGDGVALSGDGTSLVVRAPGTLGKNGKGLGALYKIDYVTHCEIDSQFLPQI